MLTKEEVLEYQQIYSNEFGENLSYELAKQKAEELLRLLRILIKPTADHKRKIYEKNWK